MMESKASPNDKQWYYSIGTIRFAKGSQKIWGPTSILVDKTELYTAIFEPSSKTRTLFATCDSFMRIYFDGKIVFEDDNYGTNTQQLKVTTMLEIVPGTKEIGISCLHDGVEGKGGIIASTSDGLITNDSWICTSTESDTWASSSSQISFEKPAESSNNFSPSGISSKLD